MKFLKNLLAGAACVATLSFGALSAKAQGFNTRWTNLLSAPVMLTNGQTLTVNSGAFPIYRDRGFAFLTTQVATNTTTAASVTYNFNFSHDKTNWTTTNPLSIPRPLASTTVQSDYTNVAKSLVDNVVWARLSSIVNGHTNSVWVTNGIVSAYP